MSNICDFAPGAENPNADPPVPSKLRPVPPSPEPCYMPQPDDCAIVRKQDEMSSVGPWATGRVDWSPIAGMTGTRPVVDKYSVTRYSESEWRKRNQRLFNRATDEQQKTKIIDWNARQCFEQTRADVDQNQEDNTKRLNQRVQEILRWKSERVRLKSASSVLMLPKAIAGECIERRTGRLDPDLVRDEVEDELVNEMALISEIKETYARTLRQIEMQLSDNKAAKQKLEYDWSDKVTAHEIEALNCSLNNKSKIIMFKPGSTIFPDEQSSEEHWDRFTRETLQEAEATRQRSICLRATLDSILINTARDLRTQADRVDKALSARIACIEQLSIKLEHELFNILQKLAEIEKLMVDTRHAIKRLDTPMKKVQTRLDNMLQRPRVENCRDAAQYGLIEEVKNIENKINELNAQLKTEELTHADLIQVRTDLEREIMIKRRSLQIDKDRLRTIRLHYPSATALSGH
ncbi:hypothetical protein FQR65_LT02543 [Abscondita terminalis]|nr:hypothetical protein FQR65_LT02543 [Abscondita terminalis]